MKSAQLPQRWLLLFLLALGSFLFCLNTGSCSLQWQELWWCFTGKCTDPMQWQLLWQLRLPRLLLGFVAGAGLALSGALLQHLSRNPLADPYVFGVIAGAGLGLVGGAGGGVPDHRGPGTCRCHRVLACAAG